LTQTSLVVEALACQAAVFVVHPGVLPKKAIHWLLLDWLLFQKFFLFVRTSGAVTVPSWLRAYLPDRSFLVRQYWL
jgi:hypothetical protein